MTNDLHYDRIELSGHKVVFEHSEEYSRVSLTLVPSCLLKWADDYALLCLAFEAEISYTRPELNPQGSFWSADDFLPSQIASFLRAMYVLLDGEQDEIELKGGDRASLLRILRRQEAFFVLRVQDDPLGWMGALDKILAAHDRKFALGTTFGFFLESEELRKAASQLEAMVAYLKTFVSMSPNE